MVFRVFRVAMCAVALVLLTSGLPEAAEISTGSVRVNLFDDVQCIVPNVGSSTISDIDVTITFNRSNGTISSAAPGGCTDVGPRQTCTVDSVATGDDYSMFCKIVSKGGKIRGTLCNLTLSLCSDAVK
jgi:hypothetical protein